MFACFDHFLRLAMDIYLLLILIIVPIAWLWVSIEIYIVKVDKLRIDKQIKRTDRHTKKLESLKSDKYKTYHDDELRNVVRLDQWRWKKGVKK